MYICIKQLRFNQDLYEKGVSQLVTEGKCMIFGSYNAAKDYAMNNTKIGVPIRIYDYNDCVLYEVKPTVVFRSCKESQS